MSDTKLTYRPDVDGLRAVAVLSVVFCHAKMSFQGGFVGVDVFFVISGYLIAGLILKELRLGTFTLGNFWERRVRRIVPAMFVMTVATMAAALMILMPEDFASYGKSLVGLALLGSNIQFWKDIDYFTGNAEEKPLLHTWSLSVEEQFYLIVPLLLLLLARKGKLHRAFAVLAILALASFGLSVVGVWKHPTATFYLLPTRAWELFAGALLAFAPVARTVKRPALNEVMATIGAGLILVPCFVYTSKTPFPGLAALPAVLGSVLVIWAGSTTGTLPLFNRFLATQPMVFIGLISYSLYLWHWPLFCFTRYSNLKPLGTPFWILLIVASFGLAVLSWRYVETPFRKRLVLSTRPPLFSAAAGAFAVAIGLGLLIYGNNGFEDRLSPRTRQLAATGTFDDRYVVEMNADLVPEQLLKLGVTNAAPELLIWGDSHAMAVLPAIESLCQEKGIAALAATHAATPPVVDYFSHNEWGLNEASVPYNNRVMQFIQSGKVRTVFLVCCWKMHGASPDFQAALMRTVDLLRQARVNIYFLREVPTYDFDVKKTLVRLSYHGEDLTQLGLDLKTCREFETLPRTVLEQLRERGVRILEPIPLLVARSKSDRFLPYDDNGSYYYDYFHLSTYGALALKPLLSQVVDSARPGDGGVISPNNPGTAPVVSGMVKAAGNE